ncbi:MAG: hypothetical protein ABJZ55_21325 [Fuerstiella sp.]
MLKIMTGVADRTAMLSPTLQFDVTSEQQQLLHAYQAQAASLKVTSEEFDGWLERIDELTGVEINQLTALHGQLIASGMLKFEISGRSVGLKYQLSQQGKKALEVKAVDPDDEDQEVISDLEDDVEVTAPAEILAVATADDEDRQSEPVSVEIADANATKDEDTGANQSRSVENESVETEACETEACDSEEGLVNEGTVEEGPVEEGTVEEGTVDHAIAEQSSVEISDPEVCETLTVQPVSSDEDINDELKLQAQSDAEQLETVAEADVDPMPNPSIAEAA